VLLSFPGLSSPRGDCDVEEESDEEEGIVGFVRRNSISIEEDKSDEALENLPASRSYDASAYK
jgi:hypothetical protein